MSYRVLIVDDSAILRLSIKRAVLQTGVKEDDVFQAGNGQEALEALAKQSVDLVLLDLNMPVMNGHEFVKACSQHPTLKNQAIVVVTTEGNQKRIQEIKALGVRGVLRKPFEPEDLRQYVGDLVGGKS